MASVVSFGGKLCGYRHGPISFASGSGSSSGSGGGGATGSFNESFSLTNAATAAVSNPMFSTGHQFGGGDMPVGYYPAVFDSTGTTQLADCQVDSSRAWEKDGSLRRCVISAIFPDAFTAGGSQSYVVRAVAGTPNTTPAVTLSNITAQDIKILCTGFDLGSDVFQCRVNDIVANGAPGVYVASLPTGAASPSGATTLAFSSLTTTVTASDGYTHPFTATKGMQVAGTGVPAGTYIASVSGGTITLSAALTGTVASGATISFSYPVYGYEVTKSGPVCSEWRFWSRLTRVSDGAIHRYLFGEIYLKAWGTAGDWEIRVRVSSPNCYGPHPSGSVGTILTGSGLNTHPTPKYSCTATLQNGATVLQSWGGPNDFRAQSFAASTFSSTTNQVAFGSATLTSSYGNVALNGVGIYFTAGSGTLPSGLAADTVYWLCTQDYTNDYLVISRGHSVSAGGASAWTAATGHIAGDYVAANNALYYCVTAGTTASSGSGPSGRGTITDGSVTWQCVSVIVGSAGSGTINCYPVVTTFQNTAWVGADPYGYPVWWQGSGSFSARPELLFAPAQTYLFQKSKSVPPFDQTSTTYPHTSLNYDFDRGTGVTWQNTYSPNTPPAWRYAISQYGDDPGDERVGDISNNQAWLLRVPNDPYGARMTRINALCFGDQPIWFVDESSGTALVGNMGPERTAGSNYPGLGASNPNIQLINTGGINWPTVNYDPMQSHGYVNSYGPLADAQHWPRPWYVPAVLDGDPFWQDQGIHGANVLILSNYTRSWKSPITGIQYAGLPTALVTNERAMAWPTLTTLRIEGFLPDGHPIKPYFVDCCDDVANAFPDYYITSAASTLPANLGTLGLIDSGSRGAHINEQQYMYSFMAGVWAQAIWQETSNGRPQRGGFSTLINNYLRQPLIDLWDSDIDAWRSEYYLAIGPGYGFAYYGTDSSGNFFPTVSALYAANGYTIAYPSSAPTVNIGNNDPLLPGGSANSTFQGTLSYPWDTNNYYTLGMYHLAWLAWAGVPGASKIWHRAANRVNSSPLQPIVWSQANNGHYDGGNSGCYFPFDILPPS